MFRNYRIKNFNFRLVVLIVALTIYGIIVIGSANEGYQNKQIIGMVLGLVVMVCVSLVDYSFVLSFHWIFYALTCGLLMVILIPGVGDNSLGATRWITFHNFRFQPSEVAKIFIVLFMAKYLMQHQENLNKPKRMML
ncbi:MAG: FtsW/RodA/SpoVE family cell cycle protein, partial [Lachnospiraceae bacterium]|nr:FtsW/RodA/SpoVE family cell cycle protein [Lachnospiraceae bacterium]